ncbi:MAG: VanZ family protein [Armatimonadota bacterium]
METKSASIDNVNRKSVFRAWLYVILYMAVIFVLSAQKAFPNIPVFDLSDKLAHAAVYAGLALTVLRAAKKMSSPGHVGPYVQAFLITVLYGASDEFHQSFVPNRAPDAWDWAADTVGAIIGLSIAAIIEYHVSKGGKRNG